MKHFGYIFFVLCWGWVTACSDPEKVVPEEEPEGYFESVTGTREYPAGELLRTILGNGFGYLELFGLADARVDAIRYYTKDPGGKRILASGIITYPASASIRGVVLSGHPSIGASREAPSVQMYALESLLALFGYAVVSPDYIGFGASAALPHPYLHVEATAGASIDMLFAAKEYMEAEARPLQDDIYIVGYSQGGAAALAIQKVAEERYALEIPVNKVIAGGGPYDLTGIFDDVKATSAEPSAYIPMTIIGLDYGDNLGLDYTKVFKDPLLSNFREWINSKKYSIS
jgi:pimeloyl-ACP methyl ester carboxylesterase